MASGGGYGTFGNGGEACGKRKEDSGGRKEALVDASSCGEIASCSGRDSNYSHRAFGDGDEASSG